MGRRAPGRDGLQPLQWKDCRRAAPEPAQLRAKAHKRGVGIVQSWGNPEGWQRMLPTLCWSLLEAEVDIGLL